MKTSPAKFRNWMSAITFAEAGEWKTAREMTPSSRPGILSERLRTIFMAAAFAEAGLHGEALQLLGRQAPTENRDNNNFLDAVGLSGARVTYAVIAAESI